MFDIDIYQLSTKFQKIAIKYDKDDKKGFLNAYEASLFWYDVQNNPDFTKEEIKALLGRFKKEEEFDFKTPFIKETNLESIKENTLRKHSIEKNINGRKVGINFAGSNYIIETTDNKGNAVNFSFNVNFLEDYIINCATDSQGNYSLHFKKIPEIRKKDKNNRTENEEKLLNEFDSLVNNVINSGIEYGVDPCLILAIIQREVVFKGLDKDVTGDKGKGYMQITSVPITDYLGLDPDGKYVRLKKDVYGPEIEDLLKSRGFDPNVPPEKRGALANKIVGYLIENKDAEFNIKLGTIVLRRKLQVADGDIKLAAQKYNASSGQVAYGKAVEKFYEAIKKHVVYITVFDN